MKTLEEIKNSLIQQKEILTENYGCFNGGQILIRAAV